ncbi:uncharacterized protein BJX67DRAFT_367899 [Aspergillus lucknowensis]|uniref:Uncharacterized protein n=1 Tax=Aspergillus lucknowensis TaxID=176173 RepID=A0ABR4L8H4_9EURO
MKLNGVDPVRIEGKELPRCLLHTLRAFLAESRLHGHARGHGQGIVGQGPWFPVYYT